MKWIIRWGIPICGVIIVLSALLHGITHPEFKDVMAGPVHVMDLIMVLGGLLISIPITGVQIGVKTKRGDSYPTVWKTIPWTCVIVDTILTLFAPNTLPFSIASTVTAIVWCYLLFWIPKK